MTLTTNTDQKRTHVAELLHRAADIIEEGGWDPRYEWRKSTTDGKSIQEAMRLVCDERYPDLDACLHAVRRLINPNGMKSLGDFEDAKGRTGAEVIALLRSAQ